MDMDITRPLYHHHHHQHLFHRSDSSIQETSMTDVPEDIILVIMSKLSLRDAVNLSVVSKQWLLIPASLGIIELDARMSNMGYQLCPHGRDTFIKGVNQFLQHYSNMRSMVALPVSLTSVYISFCLRRDSSADIDRWIGLAVSNGVTSLFVHLDCQIHAKMMINRTIQNHDDRYIFPWQLINKSSVVLKTLILRSCIFRCCLTSKLASLETLTLCDTLVTEHDMDRIRHCFPILKRLTLNCCEVPAKLTLAGRCLTFLFVQFCIGLEELEVLNGRDLTEFVYKGRYCVFNLTGAHRLTNITFRMSSDAKVARYVLLDVHQDFPAMKSLSIFRFSETAPPVPPLLHLEKRMTSFLQLEELKLYCHPGRHFSLSTMKGVLKACPKLRRLEIIPPCTLDSASQYATESPVQYRHKCLRIIKIIGFCGSLGHIELAKFLVQVSETLHHVIIEQKVGDYDTIYLKHSGSWHGEEQPEAVKDVLLKLLRNAQLTFC